ncbi:hypothetical protein ACHAAC_12455 [Aeromicrobium sp. CF4.19]|uniref:hypothetical protein n=1 Tax=Aeromicrobium sp. CF4.19 TaxID=3373082 RepID=UPI003EE455BF
MSAERSAAEVGAAVAEAERRRRAALLLGDLLPESTSDDVEGRDEVEASSLAREAELRRDVPPHHGG